MEAELVALAGTCSIILILIMQFLQLITKGHTKEINLALSLEIFAIVISLHYLIKATLEGGIWKNDEAKIALFLGFQAWMISFVVLYITPEYVDLEVPKSFEAFIGRLNEGLKSINIRVTIGYEYFCILMSTIAALITIAQTKPSINFTYYYHVKTRGIAKFNRRSVRYNYHKFFLHLAFIFPMLIIVTYVPALLKDLVVPDLISDFWFNFIRVILLFCYTLLKLFLTPGEMQWTIDLSYSYIVALPSNLNDFYFETMTNRMLSAVNTAWTRILGYLSCAFLPLMSCVLIFHKGTYFFSSDKLPSFNFDFLYEKISQTEEDEEITSVLKDEKVNPFALGNIGGIISEVNNKGLIPPQFYRSIFNFILSWWIVSYFAISLFALVYFRRSQKTSKKST